MTQEPAEYVTEAMELLKGESPNIETTTSGFTPCPDALIEKYSHTTALIWGKIWRYCQMPEDVCRAAIERIAKELGLSANTIAKHISLLEEGKYIKDTTPTIRNKPHIYVDTGKLRLKISLAMTEIGTQKLSSRYSKTEHEESTTRGDIQKNIFALYEGNIGILTPLIADTLEVAEKDYPPAWIEDVIKLAVENNKRNWRYCEAILKRWKVEGKDDGKGKPKEQIEYTRML